MVNDQFANQGIIPFQNQNDPKASLSPSLQDMLKQRRLQLTDTKLGPQNPQDDLTLPRVVDKDQVSGLF